MAQILAPVGPGSPLLRVLAPEGQFPDWLQLELGRELGSFFQVQTYALPEDALTLLQSPGAEIDLALISERIVPALRQAQALRPLPAAQGPAPDHLYLGHYFDRDNRYVIPYAWAVAVLAYRSDKIQTPPTRWSDLTAGGYLSELFSADPYLLPALWAKYHQTLPHAYSSGQMTTALYQVGTYHSLYATLDHQPAWKFTQPEGGSLIDLRELALPINGKNPSQADRAVPLFMQPVTLARLDSENFLAVTQPEALPRVPPEVAHNPLVYAPHKIVDLSSFIRK